MSIELILVGIGILLGIANLVYWVWWARRDKVAVVNSAVYPEFLPKGSWIDRPDGESIFLHNYAELSIEASCELVLTSGQKEIEVKEVEAILHEVTCNRLRKYFHLPLHNRLYLDPIDIHTGKVLTTSMLQPKKAMRFKTEILLNCTDEFGKEYEKMENGSYPEFIQPLLDKLETKYQIRWTRYDGKRLCWKFPQAWWRNLGKRLWG